MKRIRPDVRILMFSGVSHEPEQAQLQVDASMQKDLSPTTVLGKIRELLASSQKVA